MQLRLSTTDADLTQLEISYHFTGPYLEILIDRCKFDNLQENRMKKQ